MAPLGQNALYAFTAHVAVVALVALVLKPFGLATDSPAWLNALIQVASVLLIWTMAQRHLLESSPRAKLIWRASPAVFALLALAILPWLPMPAAAAPAALATPVSDAVLARALAYGTPVVSLNRTKTSAASTAAPAVQPVLPTVTPDLPQPTITPAPVEAAAVPLVQEIAFRIEMPAAQPSATPTPELAEGRTTNENCFRPSSFVRRRSRPRPRPRPSRPQRSSPRLRRFRPGRRSARRRPSRCPHCPPTARGWSTPMSATWRAGPTPSLSAASF